MMVFDPAEFDKLNFELEEYLSAIVEDRRRIRERDLRPPCKWYSRGQCDQGNNCEFRHGRSDKSIVCKHWLRGLCKKNDNCEFLHEFDMSRMPLCHFFQTYKECSNEECPFRHISSDDRVKDCQWYNRGFCKHGSKCRNRHVRNEPCADYLAGFCLKGKECKFGHPKHELPVDTRQEGENKEIQQAGHAVSEFPNGTPSGSPAHSDDLMTRERPPVPSGYFD